MGWNVPEAHDQAWLCRGMAAADSGDTGTLDDCLAAIQDPAIHKTLVDYARKRQKALLSSVRIRTRRLDRTVFWRRLARLDLERVRY